MFIHYPASQNIPARDKPSRHAGCETQRIMPRIARIVIEGLPHHITQRGNNRAKVFFSHEDREFYLRTLAEQSRRYGLEILGYCLMTNHVHLVAVPSAPDSMALAVGRTHYRYAQRINQRRPRDVAKLFKYPTTSGPARDMDRP